MITLRNIISNLSHGQSSIKVSVILDDLNRYYNSIKDSIRLTYAKQLGSGMIIYFKIPSEKDKTKFYDICVYAGTKDKINLDTQIKIYSNSPHFAFNFAYVYYKEGALLFSELYPSEFKTLEPVKKNPNLNKGFDKHSYACFKYLTQYKNLSELSDEFKDQSEPTLKPFQLTKEEKEVKLG